MGIWARRGGREVSLVELFGYSSDIRSLTAGRGSFTMEPLTYERVPDQVAKEILS